MSARVFLRCCLLGAVFLPAVAWAADQPAEAAMSGTKTCRFEVPEGWSGFKLKWEGACVGGKADGKGALKALGKAGVERTFFGTLVKGQLTIGVIDTADGFIAGKFESGHVVETGDRSTVIKSFEEASAAAQAVSERFEKAGNTASARFYADKAKKLADQMD